MTIFGYAIGIRAIIAAIGGLAIVGVLTFLFMSGYKKGSDRVNAEWDKGLAVEEKQGEEARTDAEHSVERDTPDSLRLDSWNRDNWRAPDQ